jgi:hypothetical protein
MKMKKLIYIFFALAGLTLVGCDDFLDRPSKTTMDDSNYWSSETNVRLFVNGAYQNYFVGYNSGWSSAYGPGVHAGEYSDDGSTSGKQPSLLQSVPKDNWYRIDDNLAGGSRVYWLSRTGASPWNFAWVRKWNLFIDRLQTMKDNGVLNDEQYNHWNGVAHFLRGFEYSRLVESFGDVPYYDHVVASTDFDDQYSDRTPRTEVMTHVMEDFDYALANVRTDDGANYINKYVVAAFASRFMLFEGTWYKYHPGSGTDALAKQFLQKAMSYAEVVMNSGNYAFDTDFRSLFGSETQVGHEAIMYRNYSADLKVTHCFASYSNLEEGQSRSANLSFLKSVRCVDGKPYTSSTVPNHASWRLQDMIVTRDPRFEATFWDEPTSSATSVYCVKFIDRIGPTYAYNGKSRPAKYGSDTNTNGYPVIRLAEVCLNYIEAKRELQLSYGGEAVTQDDLDKTINAIRNRPIAPEAKAKGVTAMAPLELNNIPDDPERTSDAQKATLSGVVTDPLLWEIRNDRRLEFYMEQFRVLDIRRYGKLKLMQGSLNPDILVGGWIDYNETLNLKKTFNLLTDGNIGKEKVMKLDGTIVTYDGTNAADMVGFRIPVNVVDRDEIQERNYLEPICTDVIKQYNDKGYTITQNPGWE